MVTGFPVGLKMSRWVAKRSAWLDRCDAWRRRMSVTLLRQPRRGLARRLGVGIGLTTLLVTTAALADDTERLTLLMMGDSLSAAYGLEQPEDGWVSLLNKRLDGEARVVNASISGETSAGGATRLPELLRQHSPDIVLLELGANDGLRGLAPSQMRQNLESMIKQSQASGARVVMLGIDIPPNYGDAYRTAFTNVYDSLAKRYDLPLVPFLLEGVALDKTLMQDDGLHPTAKAQPMILDNVWPTLVPLIEQATAGSGDNAHKQASDQAKAAHAKPAMADQG